MANSLWMIGLAKKKKKPPKNHCCIWCVYNLEPICRLHLCNQCSSSKVSTDAIIRDVSLAHTLQFLGHPSALWEGLMHMSYRGRQREAGSEREKGIYRKMGLRCTFSRKEPFQDQVCMSQFPDRQPQGLDWGCFTQDGEPDFQTLSLLLQPPPPLPQIATSLRTGGGTGLRNLQMWPLRYTWFTYVGRSLWR